MGRVSGTLSRVHQNYSIINDSFLEKREAGFEWLLDLGHAGPENDVPMGGL